MRIYGPDIVFVKRLTHWGLGDPQSTQDLLPFFFWISCNCRWSWSAIALHWSASAVADLLLRFWINLPHLPTHRGCMICSIELFGGRIFVKDLNDLTNWICLGFCLTLVGESGPRWRGRWIYAIRSMRSRVALIYHWESICRSWFGRALLVLFTYWHPPNRSCLGRCQPTSLNNV